MKEFYEKYREAESELVVISNADQTFPTHFHNNIELLLCSDSRYEIIQNGRPCNAQGRFIAFTDSYVPHSYRLLCKGDRPDHSILIPKEYQHRFRRLCGGKRPESTVLYDRELIAQCLMLIESFYKKNLSGPIDAAIGEMLLALLLPRLTLTDSETSGSNEPIVQILSYIDNHFKENVRLSSIAAALGYRPEHLSRVFHKFMGVNIKTYINRQRLNALSKLTENHPEKRLCDLVYEAGFNSLQSYYRCKAMEQA